MLTSPEIQILQVSEFEEDNLQDHLEAFVTSDIFEIGCGVAILYSVLAISLEVDGYPAPVFVQFSENFVTSFFLVEWCVRIAAFKIAYFKDPFHWLDTFIVWIPGVLAVWFLQPLQAPDGLTDAVKTIRIARMLRLLNLVRVFSKFTMFADLWMLVRGLLSSINTLISAIFLLVFNLYLFGIVSTDLIGHANFNGAASDAKEAQEKFMGLAKSMLTLTRFMHGDDSQDIMDSLQKQLPYIWIFLWIFTAVSNFVLLNLVTAVIVQQALDISKGDEQELALELKRKQEEEMKEFEAMFAELDEDGSGAVSLEEFEIAFSIPEVRNKLLLLGLKEKEMYELFKLLDTDGEGKLDLAEFTQGMGQLRGVARSKDMVMLIKGIDRIDKYVQRLPGGPLHPPSQEELVKQKISELRGTLDVRLKKSEAAMAGLANTMDRLLKDAETLSSTSNARGKSPLPPVFEDAKLAKVEVPRLSLSPSNISDQRSQIESERRARDDRDERRESVKEPRFTNGGHKVRAEQLAAESQKDKLQTKSKLDPSTLTPKSPRREDRRDDRRDDPGRRRSQRPRKSRLPATE
eukprot:TRINITY_DN13492_c5_g1_i1.p1 TRINITY_DN13492_c5_g1~~TRINITY_DN13492_c5_g1_i1.p1  ORF type:complete len:574 (-),score=93.30 TRINITY_DN13492_c5_g1_i1:47-1768(-)